MTDPMQDPGFLQDPYPTYAAMRSRCPDFQLRRPAPNSRRARGPACHHRTWGTPTR